TVTAESAAAAKQLLSKVQTETAVPGICGAYSEAVEVDAEIGRAAADKAKEIGATAMSGVYVVQIDPKLIEEKMRAGPAAKKSIDPTVGYYSFRYRTDKPYSRVNIGWSELVGYDRDTGKFQEEHPQGQGSVPPPRMAANAPPLTGRTKIETLKPGAYR